MKLPPLPAHLESYKPFEELYNFSEAMLAFRPHWEIRQWPSQTEDVETKLVRCSLTWAWDGQLMGIDGHGLHAEEAVWKACNEFLKWQKLVMADLQKKKNVSRLTPEGK